MDIEQYIGVNDCNFEYEESPCHQVPLQFYDNQSQIQTQETYLSVNQVVENLTKRQNFIDSPLSEIIEKALQDYKLKPEDIQQLTKKIRKTKNVMKRHRAKSRSYMNEVNIIYEKKPMLFEESSTEKDTFVMEKEIKKQRNRISAQVSRDRKKHYVNNLETKNKQLAIEAENLKLENQKLKQMLFEKKSQPSKGTYKANGQRNKLMRLFVLLGIVFFIYILQDIFGFKAKNLLKSQQFDKQDQQSLSNKVTIFEDNDLIEDIKKEITEMDCEYLNFQPIPKSKSKKSWDLKQAVLKKVTQIKKKTKQFLLPSGLASLIMESKNTLLF